MTPTSAQYSLERHEHGWLICAAPHQLAIPTGALGECMKLFPKSAMTSPSIADSINAQGYHVKAIMAVGTTGQLARWEKQIGEQLAGLPPESRWWLGSGKGASSKAIFRVLCSDRWKEAANREARNSVPMDSGDFGRCKRLIDLMPEWRARLPEVAAAYPETKWPGIIALWDELVAASPEKQRSILDGIPDPQAAPKGGK